MLMLVNILLLLLGTFMDMAPMLLICTPILLPVMKTFGVDPVHFGMIMIVNLAIGLITPPVGPTLFVGCAIGKVTIEQVSKELWPFYGAMCVALLIITYVPWLSTLAPEHVQAIAQPAPSQRGDAASTRAAQYLNSGILPNGSRAALVSRFAAAST